MNIDLSKLKHFYGSETFRRHWTKAIILTEGAQYLEDNGAAWLFDKIATLQPMMNGELAYFQLWKLVVSDDQTAVLTCQEDSGVEPVHTEELEYTDFPAGELKLYVELGSLDGVHEHRIAMLPSER